MDEFLQPDNFNGFVDQFQAENITKEFIEIVRLNKKDIRHYVCLRYLIERKIEKLTTKGLGR